LHKVDLRTGRCLAKAFPNRGHGHSVVVSPRTHTGWFIPENGKFIHEFNLDSLETRNSIEVASGLAGGHGACSADGRRLYFVDRSTCEDSWESHLIVYDVEKRSVIARHSNVGIFAHDVAVSRDERRAVIASYGVVVDLFGEEWSQRLSPQARLPNEPSVSVVDLEGGAILFKKVFTENILVAHVVFGPDEKTVMIQATRNVPYTDWPGEKLAAAIADRGDSLTEEEVQKGRIFLSGEQFKINLVDFSI
jgi:hypothetical protein